MSEGSLNISVDQALVVLAGDAQLLDVRERDEWSAGHDPIAIHMPMARIQVDSSTLDQERPVLVICRSGQRSLTAAAQLQRAGFAAVSVDGGMGAWQQAGRTVVSDSGDPGTII